MAHHDTESFIAGWRALPIVLAIVVLATGAWAAEEEERVVLHAESQRATAEGWHGEGEVQILYQDIDLRCDAADYNRSTGEVVATGNVIVDRGPSRFTANQARFNIQTKTGVFYNATAFIDPMYTFTGREIEKLDETHYRIDRATFTTCQTDGKPPWSFHVRKAKVEQEGLGHFTSSAMKVRGVPVFYMPYMVWPVKQERAFGLLFPRLGYSNVRGFNFGLPLYVPIGRSYDTTIFADYYTDGFFGLGNNWRWAPVRGAMGEINLYALWDREREETEWKVFGRHSQEDFLGFRLLAQVESLSDIDFWQDFDRSFDANTRRDLYSYVFLTRSFGPYALNLRADHRRTFLTRFVPPSQDDDDERETQTVVLSQLPEFEVRSSSTPVLGSQVYLNLIASLSYLHADRGEVVVDRESRPLVGTYGRADIFPQFSYTLPGPPWLSVTPRVGGRYTYYTSQYTVNDNDRPTGFLEESIDRLYATAGVDVVGPSLSRVFEGGLGRYQKVKHLVEPRFEYRYLTTTTDVTRIPIFDEVDSTPRDANLVNFVLANRLLGRGPEGVGTRELGSLEIMQAYSFGAPLTGSVRFPPYSQYGPLGMSLRLTPTSGTGFDARVSYNLLYKYLNSTSLAASLMRPLGMLNLTWYQSYFAPREERSSSQLRGLIAFRKAGFPFDASIQIAYDIHNDTIGDQRYGIKYQGSCWNISAQYRDTRIGAFPTREFLIVIGLKGVGALPEIKGSLGGY
jgi:LPS-assembly protein